MEDEIPKDATDSNKAITISFAKGPFEGGEGSFHPEFSHQIFEDEIIQGYKNPTIKILFCPGSLKSNVQVSWERKKSPKRLEPITDILGKLREWLPEEAFNVHLDDFQREVEKDQNFQPIGDVFHEYTLEGHPGSKFILTMANSETPGFEAFQERMDFFGLISIDGFRYYDKDPRWSFAYLFEKRSEGGCRTLGFASIYSFFAFPDGVRPRISQFLILPPYRKRGHGKRLYEAVFSYLTADRKTLDVTVEEPAESFQALRTLCDLKYIQEKVKGPLLEVYLSRQKRKELQKTLKIGSKQLVSLLEILIEPQVRKNEADLKKFRLAVKRRFFTEDEELAGLAKNERIAKLSEMFTELVQKNRMIYGEFQKPN